MKELGKSVFKLPDGFYMIKDGVVYVIDIVSQLGKSTTIPNIQIAPDDELQHVEYTSAQCGYEK